MVLHWVKAKDGKEYPVVFSNYVGTQLAMREGVAVSDVHKLLSGFSKWTVTTLYRFYFFAFKAGALAAKTEFDLNEDEFVYWVTDGDETIMPQVQKIMTESQPDDKKKPAAKDGK